MHRDSVYRRGSLDGIVKEQPEVLRELEEIVGFIRWNSKRTDKRSNGSGWADVRRSITGIRKKFL